MMGHPNITGNDAPFDEFIEVINDYEHESLTGSAVLQVKGSLRRNISFWRDIGAPEFILSIIQDVFLSRQFPPSLKHGRNTNSLLGSKRFFG